MAFCMAIMVIIRLSVFQMLIGQDVRKIEDPLQDIVSLLEVIWFHGKARNIM